MTPARMQELSRLYQHGLLDEVIPFWLQHGLDRVHGGYLTCLDQDGTVYETDKGVWQQGRFAWMLGELYNQVEPREEWLDAAKLGIDFLDRHGFDPSDGRMWFHLTREGQPIRKRRYAYSENFAAIAYGEYAKATGNSQYAGRAEACFRRFLQHHSESNSSVQPKFEATRPLKSLGIPMITIGGAQELRESIGLHDADVLIDTAIQEIRSDFLDYDHACVLENVSMKGEFVDHIDGRLLNPGHALEAAWFVLREAEHRGRDTQLIALGTQMLDWMWHWGWDKEQGGILYFRDVMHRPPQEYWHDMKFWWPHNEAMIATLFAYRLTNNAQYAAWHEQICQWANAHFHDAEFGEWFGYLHRDGTVSHRAKGNLWKGPFHLPRMQLVCWKLLDAMLGSIA